MSSTSSTTGVWEPGSSETLKQVPPSFCTRHHPGEGAQTPDTKGTGLLNNDMRNRTSNVFPVFHQGEMRLNMLLDIMTK